MPAAGRWTARCCRPGPASFRRPSERPRRRFPSAGERSGRTAGTPARTRGPFFIAGAETPTARSATARRRTQRPAIPVMHTNDLAAVGLGAIHDLRVRSCTGKPGAGGGTSRRSWGSAPRPSRSPCRCRFPASTIAPRLPAARSIPARSIVDGTVSCWGGNTEGQVGQPVSTAVSCPESTGSPTPCVKSPTLVPGLTNVAEVHAGETYTCARKNDMTVWCWGGNFNGTLGDGTNTSRSTPARRRRSGPRTSSRSPPDAGSPVRAHAGGTVSCWGQNDTGQLGNQTTGDKNKPVAVLGINDATQIGRRRAPCLRAACFRLGLLLGDRTPYGQLGNGTMTNSPVPQDVSNHCRRPPRSPRASFTRAPCPAPARRSVGAHNDANEDRRQRHTKTPRPQPASVAGFM